MKIAEFLKNRRIRILLCVQFLLILIGVVGLFGPKGIVADKGETERLLTDGISLGPGVYTARIYYEMDEDAGSFFSVTAEGALFKGLLSNEVPLYKGAGKRECQF